MLVLFFKKNCISTEQNMLAIFHSTAKHLFALVIFKIKLYWSLEDSFDIALKLEYLSASLSIYISKLPLLLGCLLSKGFTTGKSECQKLKFSVLAVRQVANKRGHQVAIRHPPLKPRRCLSPILPPTTELCLLSTTVNKKVVLEILPLPLPCALK